MSLYRKFGLFHLVNKFLGFNEPLQLFSLHKQYQFEQTRCHKQSMVTNLHKPFSCFHVSLLTRVVGLSVI